MQIAINRSLIGFLDEEWRIIPRSMHRLQQQRIIQRPYGIRMQEGMGGYTGGCKEKIGVLTLQGWRSVSVVCPPSGMVLYAASGAPDFLRAVTGRLLRQWDNIETLFERGKH